MGTEESEFVSECLTSVHKSDSDVRRLSVVDPLIMDCANTRLLLRKSQRFTETQCCFVKTHAVLICYGDVHVYMLRREIRFPKAK